MKYLWQVVLVAVLAIVGCSRDASNPRTLSFTDGLQVHFVLGEDEKAIKEVEFKKGDTTMKFGGDAEGVIFREIVSPDKQWIILPQTLWGDFLFCKRENIFECLRDQTHFSRITEGSEYAVYFRFIRWEAPAKAIISFAFNNDEEEWQVDLESNTAAKVAGGNVLFEPKFEHKQ